MRGFKMNTHPTIAALKARLESEKIQFAKTKFPCEAPCDTYRVCDNCIEAMACRIGHEAATKRLIGIIERAVEMANEISAKANMTIYNHSEEFMDGANAANIQCAEIAKEFLSTLADVSGEIKKEGK